MRKAIGSIRQPARALWPRLALLVLPMAMWPFASFADTRGKVAPVDAGLAAVVVRDEPSLRFGPLASGIVKDSTLDSVRGGFISPDGGLRIAFSVQRTVHLDGNLATAIRSGVPENGVVSAAERPVGSADLTSFMLIQRGAGNVFVPAQLGTAAAASVIQNTLDNQRIQAVTTIDVRVNSLQVYQGMSLQSTLGNAIAASLRR